MGGVRAIDNLERNIQMFSTESTAAIFESDFQLCLETDNKKEIMDFPSLDISGDSIPLEQVLGPGSSAVVVLRDGVAEMPVVCYKHWDRPHYIRQFPSL